MRYLNYDVVLNEVPNEISLSFSMTGCPLRCRGCHSPELRNPNLGEELDKETLFHILDKYESFISCVLFFGGDWNKEWLIKTLTLIKERYNLKLCLYSGFEAVSSEILDNLDYVKVGPYIEELGPLNCETTNQMFFDVNSGDILNMYFTEKRIAV